MPELDEWKTAITHVGRGRIAIRGIDIAELIAEVSFGHVVCLMFRGVPASDAEARMVEGILIAMADHGVHAPSTLATRIAASAGTPLQTSVAAGIAAIGDSHGGALEGAMHFLQDLMQHQGDALHQHVLEALDDVQRTGTRIPGFGHPYHSPDPRAVALRSLSDSLGLSGSACRALDVLAEAMHERYAGRLLPNADGAAAAILLDMGFSPLYGRGFFVIGRSVGLVAHAVEEETRERPVRTIEPEKVIYDGPGA